MTRLLRITLFSAALAAALLAMPQAAATPESDFCRSLSSAGVSGDCVTLTELAREVCTQKARGVDLATVVQKLDVATKDENVSNFIVAGAQLYLCPEGEAST